MFVSGEKAITIKADIQFDIYIFNRKFVIFKWNFMGIYDLIISS
jgi:hypothetical protein